MSFISGVAWFWNSDDVIHFIYSATLLVSAFLLLGPQIFLTLYRLSKYLARHSSEVPGLYAFQLIMLKEKKKLKFPQNIPGKTLAWENVTYPYLKISLSPLGCSTMIVKCTSGIGVWYHNSQPTGTPRNREVSKRPGIGGIVSNACPELYSPQRATLWNPKK